MAELVYTRVSTDEQSTTRQTHLLAAAGLTTITHDGPHDVDVQSVRGVRVFSDPATSSKVPALQNELTREGLAAAWAGGAVSGRRPRVAQLGVLDDVRQSFRDGASIAALARDHQVSRAAVRTALADLLPGRTRRPDVDVESPTSAGPRAEVPLRIEMPGTLARRLHDLAEHSDLGEPEQRALRDGRTVRRGRGYSLQITAPSPIHHTLLRALADLDDRSVGPAERKAYRIYRDRVRGPHPRTLRRR